MKLSDSKAAILFRFHDRLENARESIKILQHFNPKYQIHALYGGPAEGWETAKASVGGLVDSVWMYQGNHDKRWKWMHSDLMTKAWYREVGVGLDFNFLFSYEYDLLTVGPLVNIYPDIDDKTLALAACEPFTKEIENHWTWTSREEHRPKFLEFQEYMQKQYGLKRQKMVCLGPGPLLPKQFIDTWAETEDIDLVNEEIAFPAYAEVFGYQTVNHGMHPGFRQPEDITQYFNCNRNRDVTKQMLQEQLAKTDGRRTFHPVKFMITLDELLSMSNV